MMYVSDVHGNLDVMTYDGQAPSEEDEHAVYTALDAINEDAGFWVVDVVFGQLIIDNAGNDQYLQDDLQEVMTIVHEHGMVATGTVYSVIEELLEVSRIQVRHNVVGAWERAAVMFPDGEVVDGHPASFLNR